jgi:hypothetical protein
VGAWLTSTRAGRSETWFSSAASGVWLVASSPTHARLHCCRNEGSMAPSTLSPRRGRQPTEQCNSQAAQHLPVPHRPRSLVGVQLRASHCAAHCAADSDLDDGRRHRLLLLLRLLLWSPVRARVAHSLRHWHVSHLAFTGLGWACDSWLRLRVVMWLWLLRLLGRVRGASRCAWLRVVLRVVRLRAHRCVRWRHGWRKIGARHRGVGARRRRCRRHARIHRRLGKRWLRRCCDGARHAVRVRWLLRVIHCTGGTDVMCETSRAGSFRPRVWCPVRTKSKEKQLHQLNMPWNSKAGGQLLGANQQLGGR